MRSSKSRSRSKQNRPRTLGNIINRVFDSSGPEGKVRGTPQQIIEKYQVLARDAQLSNDRVAAENFLQHAEHYTRMLAEAQREMAAEQEARQQQYNQAGNGNGGQQGGNRDRDNRDFRDREGREGRNWRDERPSDNGTGDQPELIELPERGESTLVETPEARASEAPRRDDRPREDRPREERGPREERNPRRERGPRPERAEKPAAPQPPAEEAPPAAAEQPTEVKPEVKPRRPRAPRKPKAEGGDDNGPREAAE